MPPSVRQSAAPRKRVNLSIEQSLIDAAKQLGVNASRAAETGIADAVKRAREEEWLKENRAGIEAHNKRVEAFGTLLKAHWLDGDGEI